MKKGLLREALFVVLVRTKVWFCSPIALERCKMNELTVHKLDEDYWPEEIGQLELVVYRGSIEFMHGVCAVVGFHTIEGETRVILQSLTNGKRLERVNLTSVTNIQVPEVRHAKLSKVAQIPNIEFATNVEGWIAHCDKKAGFVSEADKAAAEYAAWKEEFDLDQLLESGI